MWVLWWLLKQFSSWIWQSTMTLICWGMVGRSDELLTHGREKNIEKQHVQEIHEEFHQAHWMVLTLRSTNMAVAGKYPFLRNLHWRCTFGYVSFGILLFVGKDSISKPPMGCSLCVDSNTNQTCLSFSGKINHQHKSGKNWLHKIVNHNSLKVFLPKNGVNIEKKMIQNSERYPTLEPKSLRRAFFAKGHRVLEFT